MGVVFSRHSKLAALDRIAAECGFGNDDAARAQRVQFFALNYPIGRPLALGLLVTLIIATRAFLFPRNTLAHEVGYWAVFAAGLAIYYGTIRTCAFVVTPDRFVIARVWGLSAKPYPPVLDTASTLVRVTPRPALVGARFHVESEPLQASFNLPWRARETVGYLTELTQIP